MRRWPLKFDKRAACEYHEQDPCKIVGVRALLHPAKGLPRPSHRVAHSRKIVKNEDDFFGRLPPEIREEIAAYLPTADFYNLRYVSRMISAIFSSQAFWATRFEVNGDRGFLSYLKARRRGGKAPRRNWQRPCHCTNETNICDGLENKKRIWAWNRWLKDTTTMTSAPDLWNISVMIWRQPAGTGKKCRKIYVAILTLLSLAFHIILRYRTSRVFTYPVPSPRLLSPSFRRWKILI